MTVIIIGASSGVGKALAEKFARNGHSLLLVSSDSSDLINISNNLSLLYSINVEYIASDANDPEKFSNAIFNKAKDYSDLNWVLFPIGLSIDGDNGQLNFETEAKIFNINLISIINTSIKLLPLFNKSTTGGLIGFGSIASERGRSTNIIYSCAKRALACYFESLRHLCVERSLVVQFYILGYVDTQLSFGKKLLFPIIHPNNVAAIVYKNLGDDFGSQYLPFFWKWIAIIVKSTPWKIFKKINF